MFSEWELRRGINLAKSFDLPDCETLRAFAALAIPMHGFSRGIQIVIPTRIPLLWYRGARRTAAARKAIEVGAFIAAAALLSYLVLRPGW